MAEYSPQDAYLAREAFKNGHILNRLDVVPDDLETLVYLRRQAAISSLTRLAPRWITAKLKFGDKSETSDQDNECKVEQKKPEPALDNLKLRYLCFFCSHCFRPN